MAKREKKRTFAAVLPWEKRMMGRLERNFN